MAPEHFAAAIEKIESIQKMSPGWNGFRAAVASEDVRRAAIEFLRDIPRRFPADVSEPTIVAPTPDGGVVLEWRLVHWPRSLELVFLPNGVYEWALREKERTLQYADDATTNELFDVMKQHVFGQVTIHLQ